MPHPTLPGTISRLLRRGSSVVLVGPIEPPMRGTVTRDSSGSQVRICWEVGSPVDEPMPRSSLLLDLSDHTSRWHAALWIAAETARLASHPALTAAEVELIEQIAWGEDCSAEDIEELRAMALRLVGA